MFEVGSTPTETPSEAKRFSVGEWVTCEVATGWKLNGKVVKITEELGAVTYTLQQFPAVGDEE